MASITQKKVFASLPCATRGKPIKLTGDPKGENFLYCNGHSVYIRNLKNPLEVDIYTEHSKPTTMARYSPSRFYIASGDIAGKIRIWDTVNKEHILKYEYQILGGAICDVSWSPENNKIAVSGMGREKFAHVFNWDTGTSVGEVGGHTKQVNTISYRPCRPYRVVTASEDMSARLFEGPPFKYKKSEHLPNFVNVARYSGDGEVVVSGGADGKLHKYDGKTFEKLENSEIGKPAHKGGIYELCFSPDSKEVLTASGDKTAKIFDVASGEEVCAFVMNKAKGQNIWENMQLGCLWQGDELVTVNGYGHIIYHDRNNPETPKKVVKGHMKPITALALTEDRQTAFTGGQEGIVYWDVESGECDTVGGEGHKSEVTDMVVDVDCLYSISMDDTLRVTSVSGKEYSGLVEKLDSQPRAVDSKKGVVAVACMKELVVFEGRCGSGQQMQQSQAGDAGLTKKSVTKLDKEPTSVSIHPDLKQVAVGFEDGKVAVYSLGSAGPLKEECGTKLAGSVKCLAYSPDGNSLAYGAGKKVGVLSSENCKHVGDASEKHTAAVRSLGWSPDSQRFATGALDSFLIVWKADMPFESRPSIKAHHMSHINRLAWVDECTILTAGHDSNVKQFTVHE